MRSPNWRSAALVGVLLALAAPPAAAQVGAVTGAFLVVTWAFDPPEPLVTQGASVPVRGLAHVLVHDTACAVDTELQVSLPLLTQGSVPGLKADPTLLAFTFTLPAGPHGAAGLPPFETDAMVPFLVVTTSATPAGTHGLVGDPDADDPFPCVRTDPLGGDPPVGPTSGFQVVVRSPAEADHPAHGGAFDLTLDAGKRGNTTLRANGTYPYHDHLHPLLRGKVVVGNGSLAADVRITATAFEPAEVRIAPGGLVTWINADNATHRVSAEEAKLEPAASPPPPPPPPRPAAPPPPPEPPTEEGPSPLTLEPDPEPAKTPGPDLAFVAAALAVGALAARRRR